MIKKAINNFKENIYIEKFSNGLEVYMFPNHKQKSFTAMIFTLFGAYDTQFKVDGKLKKVPTGVAHFLEHKLFERKDNPFEFYSKYGSDVNAFTTKDITAYYFSGDNNFDKSLKYLINWVTSFNVEDKDVEKEKGIILEEANMYKDSLESILNETESYNLFNIHPYNYKTIGYDKDIKSITKEDLYLCYNSFYTPENMRIIISGNFNVKKALKIIKQNIDCFKKSNNIIEKQKYSEPCEVYKEFETINKDVEIPRVSVSFKIPKKNIPIDTKYYLDYYMNILLSLTFGSTTLFYDKYLKEGLFSSLSYYVYDTDDYYILSVHSKTSKPEELIDLIINEIKNNNYTLEDFERIKKVWISSEVRIIEDAKSLLYNALDDIIEYGKYKNNKIADIKSLSFKEFTKVKEKISFENITKIIIKK